MNDEDYDNCAETKAWDEIARLTSGAGPAANWRWSIPAKPDRDSDLILAAGLQALADECARLRGIISEIRTAAIEQEHDHDPGGCTCGCPVDGCYGCGGAQ